MSTELREHSLVVFVYDGDGRAIPDAAISVAIEGTEIARATTKGFSNAPVRLHFSPNVTALTNREGPDGNPTVSPKGDWIAYTGYDDKKLTSTIGSLYVMDRNGGSKKLLVGSLLSTPQIEGWSPDGVGVYYSVEEKGTSYLYFAPVLGGVPRKVTGGTEMLTGLSVSDSGQVAALRTSFTQPSSLVTFNLKSPSAVRVLVDVNQDVLEGRRLGQAEELWYTSKDGMNIQGWLIKPANFEAGKKYPMVLWIHGGPWSMYSVALAGHFRTLQPMDTQCSTRTRAAALAMVRIS